MSTRSRIAIAEKNEAGVINYRSIYVHFDGKDIHKTLTQHYNTEEDAKRIVDLGDLSAIHEDKIIDYRSKGDAWDSVKPIHNCSLSGLFKTTRESSGQYLNLFHDGEWEEFKI